MSVYVGQMFNARPYGLNNWRYGDAAHLLADTEEELHEMAIKLRLKRSWFQAHGSLPHYDLTVNKRREAIKAGAVELHGHEEGRKIREMRVAAKNKRLEAR